MDHAILWGVLLIPATWLLSLVILLHDELHARKNYSREERYLSIPDNSTPSNQRSIKPNLHASSE